METVCGQWLAEGTSARMAGVVFIARGLAQGHHVPRGCEHFQGRCCLLWSREARDTAEYPGAHRMSPCKIKHCPTQNISHAKPKKLESQPGQLWQTQFTSGVFLPHTPMSHSKSSQTLPFPRGNGTCHRHTLAGHYVSLSPVCPD